MAERNPTAPQVVDPLERQINDKRETILQTPVETLSEVKCNTHELETMISSLGKIVELPVSVPRYATFHTSIVAAGKQGSAPGELFGPQGVAIHEDTHIFVANQWNDRVEIFSETGEFLYQLGVGQLSQPYGIATHGDSLYVSCWGDHTVSKFSLTEMWRVRRIGGRGSDNRQFNYPRQLTTDPIGRVFIADTGNNRICIHDPDLNHLRNITHDSMSRPFDVKVSRDRLYVLCPDNNPCMHVLTLEGDKLHSFITRKGMDVLRPRFFCNFVISDAVSHSICVFSPEGYLLHTIGSRGDQQGMSGVGLLSYSSQLCLIG